MQKEKNSSIQFAMQAGLGLGGFWLFKYIFIIASKQYPALGYVNPLLSFLTPLLLLFYLIKFKSDSVDNELKYWKGVRLGILLFFFASIVETVFVIPHIVWIDPTYIAMVNEQKIGFAQSLGFNDYIMEEFKKQISFSPFIYIYNLLLSNVFLGFMLSLILSPVASKISINIKNLD